MVTGARLEMPMACAAAGDMSMMRPRTKGPRSLIVTTTEFPVLRLVTRTLVPNGSDRCAAVKAAGLSRAPLAVLLPLSVEYTDAMPLCRCAKAGTMLQARI